MLFGMGHFAATAGTAMVIAAGVSLHRFGTARPPEDPPERHAILVMVADGAGIAGGAIVSFYVAMMLTRVGDGVFSSLWCFYGAPMVLPLVVWWAISRHLRPRTRMAALWRDLMVALLGIPIVHGAASFGAHAGVGTT